MTEPLPFPIPLDRPLVLLDMETTGLRIGTDRIVELAVIRLSPNGDVTERVRRFDPQMPIPPEATAVHGISDADVQGEATFAGRAKSLARFLDPCDLAGFNLRRFDLPVLLAEFRRARVPFDVRGRRLVDVQTIFHREEPRDLGAAVRFYLNRELEDAHTALADIRATAAVLAAQLDRYEGLPREMDGLHRYCDEVRPFETELDLWFLDTEDHGAVFRRGKYRDQPLGDVARRDPDYLRWMVSTDDMDEQVKDAVRKALGAAEESYRP
jgi:DNA polymerase-3 subunit epsilon